MAVRNSLLLKKVRNQTITFSAFKAGMNTLLDESMLPTKYAKTTFNYTVKDGTLKNGMGFSTLMLPRSFDPLYEEQRAAIPLPSDLSIINLWQNRTYSHNLERLTSHIIIHVDNGELFNLPVVAPTQHTSKIDFIEQILFTGSITGVNYQLNGDDCFLLFVPSQKRILVISNAMIAEIIEDMPELFDIELHHERLFAIPNGDKRTLMFSANLDPTNWNPELDEGGFINLLDERGIVLKLVSFNDYLYVFREFGVSRVSAYGSQEDFSVTHLFSSSSQIYKDSVVACGDRILFFTSDGLFVFDGFSGNKISIGIENLLTNQPNHNCKGAFFENKYYLALRINFDDGVQVHCEKQEDYVNNALLEYNIQTGEVNIMRGVDISELLPVKEKQVSRLVASFRGENAYRLGQLDSSGLFFENQLEAVWSSPKTNFGYAGKTKILKEVVIQTSAPCRIVVESDVETKTYEVKGKNKVQRIKTYVIGESMQISFVSKSPESIEIKPPQITIGVVG